VLQVHCASYWFGFCELSSMHNEPVFAKFAVINVQPRFSAVLPLYSGSQLTIALTALSLQQYIPVGISSNTSSYPCLTMQVLEILS
jgi:hypothetical protein